LWCSQYSMTFFSTDDETLGRGIGLSDSPTSVDAKSQNRVLYQV
jgi:hypothetical protein